MVIIGITGTIGAGKGTIVDYLVKNKNFKHYSVRDFLLEEINKRNLPQNRDSMVIVANELRKKYGSAYIIEQLLNKALKANCNSVIESIRNVGEVDKLKQFKNFYLIAIDADIRIRYERIKKRQSVTDNISFEEFVMNEEREMNSDNPNEQNIKKCIELAQFKLINNSTFEDLYKQIDDILEAINVQ